MKTMIKLYPAEGVITDGCMVKTDKGFELVTKDNIANLNKPRLHKYYVTERNKLVGELHFADYPFVKEGDKVECKQYVIYNKPEIGDEVEVFKLPCDVAIKVPYFKKYLSGRIVSIKSTNITVSLHGSTDELTIKRHCVRLVSRQDKKTICKLI